VIFSKSKKDIFLGKIDETPWNSNLFVVPFRLPSMPSKQLFTTTSYLPPSKTSIFSTPVNPSQTHLLQILCFPSWKSLWCPSCIPHVPCPIPLPSTDLMSLFPTVLSFPLPPLLSHAPLAVCCVLALIWASTRYTKKKKSLRPFLSQGKVEQAKKHGGFRPSDIT